jgi:hypothetical protein
VSDAVAKVKEGVRKILVAALFFSIGFCLIHLANHLLTEGSSVEIAKISQAIVGGFFVAKVLLTVDLLPFVDAFPNKPLIQNIAWKTSLYVVAGVIFLYLEPFVKSLVKGEGVYAAGSHAWHELMLPRTWATVIWVAMLLTAYATMTELSRVIGRDQLKHMFLGGGNKSKTEGRLRGAA